MTSAFNAALVTVRRAIRLRRPDDAAAAVRGLLPIMMAERRSPADLFNVMTDAFEDAGIPERRAMDFRRWLFAQIDTEGFEAAAAAALPAHLEVWEREWIASGLQVYREAVAAWRTGKTQIPADEKQASIQIAADYLSGMIDTAEQALMDARLHIYQKAGQIVRLSFEDDGAGGEQAVTSPVDETHVAELFGRVVAWSRFDARSKAWRPAGCPAEVARAYVSRGPAEWRLPRLTGIINAPTLRADGSLLDIPGFDQATGLFHACDHERFPMMPGTLDQGAAYEAIEALCGLLEEFPFVDMVDRSVALAAILTAVVRRSLATAPMFAFTAPTPGSGKSLLVDIVSIIATGRPASCLTWSEDDSENRKAIDAALLAGAEAIHFDNVTGPIGGDRLNQIVTQRSATVRVLGASKVVDVPCSAFITANGNNLAIAADMTRRTMLCRLDSGLERPEEREFASSPLAELKANRGEYLIAALTILRAYHLAGRPGMPKPLGSFETWSSWVRGALIWVGEVDPVGSLEAVRANDPVRSSQAAVLEQWAAVIGSRRVTSAQIIQAATGIGAADFREALLAVAGVQGAINTQRLGAWLRSAKGKPVSLLKVEQGGVIRGTTTWVLRGCLEVVEPTSGSVDEMEELLS